MREIKFRGKTSENKWVYGYIGEEYNHLFGKNELFIKPKGNFKISVIDGTVGQYTGFETEENHDGTKPIEIYEDDHVGFINPNMEWEIGTFIYDEEYAGFRLNDWSGEDFKYIRFISVNLKKEF